MNFGLIPIALTMLGDIDVGLIDTGLLESVRSACENAHDALTGSTIETESASTIEGVAEGCTGTPSPSFGDRHGGANTEFAGSIIAG